MAASGGTAVATGRVDGRTPAARERRRRPPSLDQLWGLVAWAVPAAAVLLARMDTNDLAYQLRAGALMLAQGRVLRVDPFTFSVGGHPWVDQQWGAQILLDLMHRPAGWAGLALVRAALVAGASGVTYLWTRRVSRDARLSVCLTIGALLVSIALPGALSLRPQLLAVPLFLAATWMVRGRADHPRRLLWTPILALVWANLHGSFVLLPLLLAIAFVADLVARTPMRWWTASALVAAVAVPLVNPWGLGIYGYVVRLATSPVVRNVIDEWLPLWRRFPGGPVFVAALVGLTALLIWRRRRLPTLEEGLGLAAFTTMAIVSGRDVLWWSLYVPPVVGSLVATRHERTPEPPAFARVMAVLVTVPLVLGVVHVATARPSESLLAGAPMGLTQAIQRSAGPNDQVFAGWWASWFEYALPHIPEFADSRAELFPTSLWDDYFTISQARPGWRSTLRRWRIDVVVTSPEHQGSLIERLRLDPGWALVYADGDGSLFVRRTSASASGAG